MTVRTLISIIDPYSAKKNKANPILAYSTLNPDTSSDSASGKSKGALFVSAKIDTKNIKNRGKKGITKNTKCWKATILIKFSELTHNKIDIRISPIDTSYDTICAALRIAPKKAYFELLDQPESITP